MKEVVLSVLCVLSRDPEDIKKTQTELVEIVTTMSDIKIHWWDYKLYKKNAMNLKTQQEKLLKM